MPTDVSVRAEELLLPCRWEAFLEMNKKRQKDALAHVTLRVRAAWSLEFSPGSVALSLVSLGKLLDSYVASVSSSTTWDSVSCPPTLDLVGAPWRDPCSACDVCCVHLLRCYAKASGRRWGSSSSQVWRGMNELQVCDGEWMSSKSSCAHLHSRWQ